MTSATYLPQGVLGKVPVASLHMQGNVRSVESDKENATRLKASIIGNGWTPNSVLTVLKQNMPKGKVQFMVLCGNGRTMALQSMTPEELGKVLPDGHIPAVIHEDLTPEQIVLIRARDFSDDEQRRPLDAYDAYLLVRDMYNASGGTYTQERIASEQSWLKKSAAPRSFIQPRINLARLAVNFPELETEYKALWQGRTINDGTGNVKATNFRVSDLAKMYAAYGNDQSGDTVRQMIADIRTGKDKTEDTHTATGPKAISSENGKRLAIATTSIFAKRLLMAATNQSFKAGEQPESFTKVAEELAAFEAWGLDKYTAATAKVEPQAASARPRKRK